jgi:hypothetical protein
MVLDDEILDDKLGAAYYAHNIFQSLKKLAVYYKDLSFHIMNWSTSGTTTMLNMDMYVYSSMHGTIESI